jgi:plastocyanin
MTARHFNFWRVALCAILLLQVAGAPAALSITVLQADGKPVMDAVVIAESKQGYPPRAEQKASMDQRNLMFVPEVLVIRTGTAVDFPNSDQVRHQVYSFSGAKTFQLPLYAGRSQPPVVFDRAGIVTLGCNIHDAMLAYIVVSDSPWTARTDAQGVASLPGLAVGNYTLKVWHSRLPDSSQFIERPVQLSDTADTIKIQLSKNLRAAVHHHSVDKQWQDY